MFKWYVRLDLQVYVNSVISSIVLATILSFVKIIIIIITKTKIFLGELRVALNR